MRKTNMALKLTDEIAVRVKNSGGLQDYVPVSEINDLISSEEAPDIATLKAQVGSYDPATTASTITADLAATKSIAEKPGTSAKLDMLTAKDDRIGEIFRNKNLIEPLINDETAQRASVVLGLSNTTGELTIYVAIPGVAGNSYTAEFIPLPVPESPGVPDPQTATLVGTALTVEYWTGGSVTNVLRMIEQLCPEALEVFAFSYATSDASKEVEALSPATAFSGGADGHGLSSTAEEIDDTVSAVAAYTPTGADLGTDVGTLWTDVETGTTGLLDRTTALETSVDTATTGLLDRTTALETIVNTATEGTPVAPVAAEGTIELDTGISLDFTAKTAGAAGNSISVNLVDPEELNETIDVSVDGTTITVLLASDGEAITSTAANVKTAIDGTPAAAALITVGITGLDSTLAIEAIETLEGGVNGTTGRAGEMLYDDTAFYVSAGISTVAVSNWKTISYDAE
jgi:hypothetical protein